MTPIPIVDAFEIVLGRARGRIVITDDAVAIATQRAEVEALNLLEDFAVNGAEVLEEMPVWPGREVDLDLLESSVPAHPLHQSVITALRLACEETADGEDEEGSAAIESVMSFWDLYGGEICEGITYFNDVA